MKYASQQDMIDRYGDDVVYTAFDRDGDDALDTTAIDRALTDASAEIDTYLAGRGLLPLPSVPAILVLLCVDIALYKGSGEASETETKRVRYEDAIKTLKMIARGDLKLGIEADEEPEAQSVAQVSAPDQIFSNDRLENF